ncbi:DUF21 domain-containing protein [Adhaeribacter radiodurans]|uniref:DUF21 domain-containing protein n=1 Tax=Adhaeribacter radiodurans TaxID=2745197 RepID=A0A7L7L664_9BACT|nr:DUF21 domain-containing protein [Adhaeribacter radiodurans]
MEIIIILILTLLNGFFALTELSIISVRKTGLNKKLKKVGKKPKNCYNLSRNQKTFFLLFRWVLP